MSNYIEYNDKIVFHPGYYIKELVEESGLTQAEFAKKLDTTPKNLSVLIGGEQSLSIDMAIKLSRMMGTTAKYWLNLQQSYDAIKAEILSDRMYEEEKEIFKEINCKFFIETYNLNESNREDEMIKRLREYFRLSSLKVLEKVDLSVDFRGYEKELTKKEIVNANAIVQRVINEVVDVDTPKYNKKSFVQSIDFFVQEKVVSEEQLANLFYISGVNFVFLPCMEESRIDALSKKIDGRVLLAVNEKWRESEAFKEIVLQEAVHITRNEFGVFFRENNAEIENAVSRYVLSRLRNSNCIA